MKKSILWFNAIVLLGIAAGCGSGGGSNVATPASSGATSKTVSVVARRSAAFFTLGLSNSGKAASPGRPGSSLLQIAISSITSRGGRSAGRGGDITFSPELGLYEAITSSTATSVTVSFYTDAAGTIPAGNITVNLRSAPNTFPAIAQASFNITGGAQPVSGAMTVTINDANGASGSLSGNITTTAKGDRVTFTFDLNLSQTSLTGTLSVKDSCLSVAFTNVVFTTAAGTMDANITANGLSGTVHLNGDGSGSVTLNGSGGTTTATWLSDGSGTIHYPDGHEDTIANFDALDPCS